MSCSLVEYSSSSDDDDEVHTRNTTEMPAPVEMPAPSVALPMTEEAQMAEEAPGVSTPSKPFPAPIFAAMFSKVGASMSPGHSRDQAKDIAARARLKASKADKERQLTEKQQEAAAKLLKRSIHSPMDLTDTPGPESPASKKPCRGHDLERFGKATIWKWSDDAKRIALAEMKKRSWARSRLGEVAKHLQLQFAEVFDTPGHQITQGTLGGWFDKCIACDRNIDRSLTDLRANNGGNLATDREAVSLPQELFKKVEDLLYFVCRYARKRPGVHHVLTVIFVQIKM